MLTVGDLFAGVGGFTLGLEMCGGFETKFFVEIDPFCQKVLRKHWLEVPIYDDITKIQWVVAESSWNVSRRGSGGSTNGGSSWGSKEETVISPIDLLTGGFPCQPFSCAGKRKGTEDDRWLWPETIRAVREIKPRYCIFENVPGLLTLQDGMVFEGVCIDLENEGYEVIPLVIPACSQGAPHRRDRVWIVAHAKYDGLFRATGAGSIDEAISKTSSRENNSINPERASKLSDRHAPDTKGKILETSGGRRNTRELLFRANPWQETWYEVATRFCRVSNGVSNRVDRLKCLGNAVVPQIVCQIGKAILEVECDLPGGPEPFPERIGRVKEGENG